MVLSHLVFHRDVGGHGLAAGIVGLIDVRQSLGEQPDWLALVYLAMLVSSVPG
jgi:hypothetical protein